MKAFLLIATISAALAIASRADAADDSTQVALELGNLLASEQECGLAYNQQAIEGFISKHVDESDMGFTSMLDTMTSGSRMEIKEMGVSQKTAHCAQIKRVAKKFGFTQ